MHHHQDSGCQIWDFLQICSPRRVCKDHRKTPFKNTFAFISLTVSMMVSTIHSENKVRAHAEWRGGRSVRISVALFTDMSQSYSPLLSVNLCVLTQSFDPSHQDLLRGPPPRRSCPVLGWRSGHVTAGRWRCERSRRCSRTARTSTDESTRDGELLLDG